MRISTIAKLGTMAAAATCMCVAGAQSNGPSGISVRLGTFLPTNNLASDLGTWFGFGIDYKLNAMTAESSTLPNTQSYFGISADYYSHGANNDVPVALTYNIRQGQMVYSGGIGPDFRNSGDLTSTGVGLGEQISATYEFSHSSNPIFIQAKYFFSSKPELSGFGLYLGARF